MTKLERQIKKYTKGLYNFWPRTEGNLFKIDFSTASCDTCGSLLAGERYFAGATKGKKHTNKQVKLEICRDCYEYFFT
jgi:hypothetical protein